MGENAQWRGRGSDSDSDDDGHLPLAERWVQFGAVSSGHVSIADRLALVNAAVSTSATSSHSAGVDGNDTGGTQSRRDGGASSRDDPPAPTSSLLCDYLALPVEDYSLLDPKWIQRDASGGSGGSNSFRFCVPLQDVIGIDLRPELTITAHPEPDRSRVTLVGTRAALGSADIDDAFRLNMVTVLSRRQRRRLPRIPRPDHLPGRPVYRLRRWAARARGRTWPAEPAAATGAVAGEADGGGADATFAGGSALAGASAQPAHRRQGSHAEGADAAALQAALSELQLADVASIDIDDPATSAPFPAEKIYISRDEVEESEEEEHEEGEEQGGPQAGLTPGECSAAAARAGPPPVSALPAGSHTAAAAAEAPRPSPAGQPAAVPAAAAEDEDPSSQLHCRVNVTMAVRVPPPLRVIPNPLLGYAGGLILRAVLNATLPNFLDLLAADFKRWAEGSGRRGDAEAAGELFGGTRADAH